MRMNDVDFGGASKLDGYGQGLFRVGGEVVRGRFWFIAVESKH